MDFGRVLGGQNPRFSHFFRCFFDIIFQARFGRRKNRPKMRKKQIFPLFSVGFAVVPKLLGKGKDRGKNTSGRIARKNVEIGQLRLDRASWSTVQHAVGTPSVAGGLKAPGGGTAASQTLARPLGRYMHQWYAQMDALTGGDQGRDDILERTRRARP